MDIKNWLKENWIFVSIIIFTIIIRFYFFLITKNQSLMWDESEYVAVARSLAGIQHFDFTWTLNRFPGFPMLVSLFYMIGITNEVVLKFFVAFIPSIVVIVLMYYMLTLMYEDKRIALVSIAIFSVLWEHLFWSNRFMTENWSLIFMFLAIMVMFRKSRDIGFIKAKYALLLIILLTTISVIFRSGNLFFIPIIFSFIILTSVPEKYRIHTGVTLGVLTIAGYILLNYLAPQYSFVNSFFQYQMPFSWDNLHIFYLFFQPSMLLFGAFLIGAALIVGYILIIPNRFKDVESKADVFNIMLIGGFLFFFIFILRSGVATRWNFAMLPAILAFTSFGIIKVGDFLEDKIKIRHISTALIITVLAFGMYAQYSEADITIRSKLPYTQVKDSGLWLKENTYKDDLIMSCSIMQHTYYAERNIFYPCQFTEDENLTNYILEKHPQYLVLSVFEPHPQWLYTYPQRHNESFVPVNAWTDPNGSPLLVIYKIKYEYENWVNGNVKG